MNPSETIPQRTSYVLVEEHQYIRDDWTRIAADKKLSLKTYADERDFLAALASNVFAGPERFYLDQDFGRERGVGVRMARAIRRRWPKASVFLVTAYPKLLFRRELAEGLIDDVFDKYPMPFGTPEQVVRDEAFKLKFWGSSFA